MASLFAKTSTAAKEYKISEQEFVQLRDFIYEQSGIYIAENRKYLLENRLSGRLKHLNLNTFGEYFYFLKFDPGKRQELSKLYECITTNETSFFRNPPQLKVFQEEILTKVIAEQKAKGQKKLRIWSAGCSSGEEPYTIAIILCEVLKAELITWDIKITANDLSEKVLAAAKEGNYTEYALRTTPPEISTKYFTNNGSGKYTIRPELKKLIDFGPINLNDKFQLKQVERSHVVFCRNVIIYFDDDMKKRVVSAFYDNLIPGGYLFIGHSESMHNISKAFKQEHYTGAIVYKREE